MTKDVQKKTSCRICGSKELKEILNLGSMPMANAFLSKAELKKEEKQFPLVLVFCKKCSLVQLQHVVNPEILFADYHYLTSASSPLVKHFETLAQKVTKYIQSPKDLVVEIGSNDGVLLAPLVGKARVLGIDPADNVAELARKRGVETLIEFFNNKVAKGVVKKYGNARVILANNVIAHIDKLGDVFDGIHTLLENDGVFIFEAHWVGNLIGKGGFDQIYHEHLCYFSLHAVKELCVRHGLKVVDVEMVPIHGESLRVYVAKAGKPTVRVTKLLAKEKKLGLPKLSAYEKFREKVERNNTKLQKLVEKLNAEGKVVAGYGAPGKGNTLLCYARFTPKQIAFITDTTPLKQGLFTPGTRIPVVSPEVLKTKRPDYMLLLSWNYAKAILEKEKELRQKGTKFIIPVPTLKIV